MLLYDNPVSGNCYKVRLMLSHLGKTYERREVSVMDKSNRMEVLGGLNPSLRVPTLVLEDGRPIGESNAILWYLADGTSYVPQDRYERSLVLQWQFFEQYDHEPNIAVARHWLHYRGSAIDSAALAERHKGGYKALDAMERQLEGKSFLVAERYSIADISLYAYTHVAHEGGFELDRYPAVAAWLKRVAAQPGHVTITA
jgi:glutathione S-transferase